MRAVVCTGYGPPEVLRLQEVEKPAPRRNEVCIRIHATAVTASDCLIRGLNLPIAYRLLARVRVGLTRPRQPILGLVLVGDIESVGEDVTRFEAGSSVYALTMLRFGGYAEYACVPEDSVIAARPSTLTPAEAAAVPYGGLLALHYLRRGEIQNRQRVLIYGASGAVGTSAIQLAKQFGAQAVTAVCSTANFGLVRSLGADDVVDYTKEDFTQRSQRYDLILDAVGKSSRSHCRKALTPTGAYVSVNQGTPKMRARDLITLTGLVEAGGLVPVVDRNYPLEQIVDAHRYVDKGHKKGNVVVTVTVTVTSQDGPS